MLTPAPDDFWQRVVAEVARQIWQRETSRGLSITTAIPAANYSHDAHKPWRAQAAEDAADLSA